jgi:hypothetical protein
MLHRKAAVAQYSSGFVVCDIENGRDGRVLAIATAWRKAGHEYVQFHHTWGEWWCWLKIQAKADKRFTRIYAHNGGRWDWVSLAPYLFEEDRKKQLFINRAGNRMVILRVKLGRKLSFTFADSFALFQSSLEKLSQKLLGEGKKEMPVHPEDCLRDDPDLFWQYLRGDVILLLRVLVASLQLIRKRIAKIETLGVTVGSTGLAVYQTIGMKDALPIPIDFPDTPKDRMIRPFLREGYHGGRVEVFQHGFHERVYVYDINAQYPSIMVKELMPSSGRGTWETSYLPDRCGCWEIDFEQPKGTLPVLLIKASGVYSGHGVYFTPEINQLLEVGGSIKVIRGFVFTDTDVIFKAYIEKVHKLRMDNKDGPLGLLCKFLENSLYGKFAQKSEREEIIQGVKLEMPVEGPCPYYPLNEDLGIYSRKVDKQVKWEHCGISGTITSHARKLLYSAFLAVGASNVIYCDTDSVHSKIPFPADMVHPSQIGKFKLEFIGEGVYAGKKLYALRNNQMPGAKEDEKEKLRAKGISVYNRKKEKGPEWQWSKGARLTFEDLLWLCHNPNSTIPCTFETSPTIMDVVKKGIIPCRMIKRTRNIRRL